MDLNDFEEHISPEIVERERAKFKSEQQLEVVLTGSVVKYLFRFNPHILSIW